MDITNCVAWFDSADASSLTLQGSNVVQWKSKVGNNIILEPDTVTSNAPPQYIHSSKAVYFDNGVTQDGSLYPGVQGLVTPTPFAISSADTSVYIVANLLDGQSTLLNAAFGIANSSFGYWIHLNRTNAPRIDTDIFPDPLLLVPYPADSLPIESPFVTSWLGGFTGATGFDQEFYVNSSLKASNTSAFSRPTNVSNTRIAISGNSVNGARTFTGYIHEILYYNVKHTPAQRQSMEAYLTEKWLLPTPQLQTSFLFYQYIPIDPVPISAQGTGQVDLFVDPATLPRGLRLEGNALVGAPSQIGTFSVVVYARDDIGTDTITLTITIVLPRILKKQDTAGAYTSLVRQYAEVNAALNSVNNIVYPTQEQKLGTFMAPDAPDTTKDAICLL